MPTYAYGGQALLEGVLMRGRDAIAVALRHPDGGIVDRHGEARLGHPQQAVREVAAGPRPRRPVRDPRRRHALAHPQRQRPGRGGRRRAGQGLRSSSCSSSRSSAAIAIFSLLPLFISSVATSNVDNGWAQPVLEGVLQVGIFLGYLALVEPDAGHPPDVPVPRRGAHDDPRPGGRRPADRRRGPQVPDGPPPLRHRVPRRAR